MTTAAASPGFDTQCTAYPPIHDYALIGDCRCAALVSTHGSIDWWCLPHYSGPALFAALLDRVHGGRFAVRPVGRFDVRRRYLPHTNVLETHFTADTGTVRLVDCMPIVNAYERKHHLNPQREVLRIVEGLSGEVELEVIFEPRPYFARVRPRLRDRGALGWMVEYGSELVMLGSDVAALARRGDAALGGTFRLRGGERRYFSCTYTSYDIGVVLPLGEHAERRCRDTVDWWRGWCSGSSYDGPFAAAVERSALALKALTYGPSGAIVAAATTSLPEAIGGRRNWDYRYCWIRDASLCLSSFCKMGHPGEDQAFLGWLLNSTRLTWPRLQIFYDIYGETNQNEQALDHLEGYCGSRPVRVGNAAADQLQSGIYGELICAVYDYVIRGGGLSPEEARLIHGFGRAVAKIWHRKDQGIWELRSAGRHHTHSKVMCWAAMDRLIRLHEQGYIPQPVEAFRHEREAIRSAIEQHGASPDGKSYAAAWGEDGVDASLLVLPHYGYQPADAPRMQETFRRIDRELTHNDLVYRYDRTTDDGMPAGENPFVITSFWAVDFLARLGEHERAYRRFEHLLSCANDVGLFAEQLTPDGREARGNFPQAFSHVGLINAAYTLSQTGGRG